VTKNMTFNYLVTTKLTSKDVMKLGTHWQRVAVLLISLLQRKHTGIKLVWVIFNNYHKKSVTMHP
jgi:hypothetical protein